MASPKKYVLLENQFPNAPISILTDKKTRVKLKGMQNAAPYLKVGVVTKDGDSKIMRLKLSSNLIYQDEQMLKGIPANEKFTNAERESVKFRNGELITSNAIVQKFLDNHPQNKAFDGVPIEGLVPMFEHRDETVVVKREHEEFKNRLKAVNNIDGMNLKQAQDMLLLLKGSFYKVPDSLEEAQLELVDLIEESPEALVKVLEEKETEDDSVNVLIGRLVGSGKLSFDKEPNRVMLLVGDKWVSIKDMPSEYDLEERQRVLVDYLTSEDGDALLKQMKDIQESNEASLKETKHKGGK